MDRRAAYRQKEDGVYCVFMMLAAMVVQTVRIGIDIRCISGLSLAGNRVSHRSADVQAAVIWLLCLAEIAAQQLMSMARADYELMKLAPAHPAWQRSCDSTGSWRPDQNYLDTS